MCPRWSLQAPSSLLQAQAGSLARRQSGQLPYLAQLEVLIWVTSLSEATYSQPCQGEKTRPQRGCWARRPPWGAPLRSLWAGHGSSNWPVWGEGVLSASNHSPPPGCQSLGRQLCWEGRPP